MTDYNYYSPQDLVAFTDFSVFMIYSAVGLIVLGLILYLIEKVKNLK